jgi:hypothetical protein
MSNTKSQQLSDKEVWFPPIQSTFELENKSILIKYLSGEEQHFHLTVKRADPNGSNSGMVALQVWNSPQHEIWLTPASDNNFTPCLTKFFKAYLEPALIDSFSPGDGDFDFVLELP